MPDWSDHSRFRRQQSISVDGVETIGRWKEPRWLTEPLEPKLVSLFHVTNEYEGRPDRIATLIYGDSTMDWVLLAFNRVRETLNWPRTGDVIRYPDGSVVFQEM